MSPVVSVLIANFNGGTYVLDALTSAARQSLRDIEIIFVDDKSTDESLAIACDFARMDARVRAIALEANSGPGAARNAGLAAARGRWAAILDSDDFMHPDRLERLVEEMQRTGAEVCADDLVVFQDGGEASAFLGISETAPRWVTPTEFVLSNQMFGSRPALGYLKPVIDLTFLRRHAICYRPTLRIGEDYDLVLQLLAQGARYRLTGEFGYFYRKHGNSVSHRLATSDVERMIEADTATLASLHDVPKSLARACKIRRRSLERALAYSRLIDALKSRNWAAAARLAVRHPSALPLMRMPIAARLERLLPKGRRPKRSKAGKQACLIVRQRVVGRTNGSSTYLLSLCEALGGRGYRICLIVPSLATFGRWPALHLGPEMQVADEVFIGNSVRIGRRLFVAKDARILFKAALTVAERFLLRLRIVKRSRVTSAPYAIALPWTKAEQLFIARHAPRSSEVVVADYAFVTPAIPYAMCPRARTLVVMHDLFCSRADQFAGLGTSDSVASLDQAAELALLDRADAIVAIQENEARFVSDRLPQKRVIVAPMAAEAVDEPQPGDRRTVLFVGSNTAPNVVGMRWFLDEIWPHVRRELPDRELLVAGRVQQAFPINPEGVRFLGLVPDLEPLYRQAGVVISPLIAGSGLKIKLIEALGRGKAIVATSVTVDGIAQQIGSSVVVADTASDFANAVVGLLSDDDLRLRTCSKALAMAKRHLSAEACYADLLGYLDEYAGESVRAN